MKQKKITLLGTVSVITVIFLLSSNEIYAQKVTKLFEKGQYEKAEQYCLKQKGENQDLCYFELAENYFKVKKYEKASEFYSKTTKSREGYKKTADAFYENKNLETALKYYKKAFDNDDEKMKETYNKIADVYVNRGVCDSAKMFYELAGPDIPNDKMGDCYLVKKKYEIAEDYYREAYKSNSDKLDESFIKLGDSVFNTGNYYYAYNFYFMATYYEGYERVAYGYLSEKKYDHAAKYFENAYYHQKEKLVETIGKIGDTCFQNKEYKTAASIYQRAKLYDKRNLCYKMIAEEYLQKRDYSNAAYWYKQANLKEEVKHTNRLRADSDFEKKDYISAFDYYEQAEFEEGKEKCLPFITFKDKRDGKIYRKVKIGNQIWMAENLRYKTSGGCWAYDNDQWYANQYGYFYDWETAKKVCPDGWHLPSREEFVTLLNNYGDGTKYNEKNYNALVTDKKGLQVLFAGEREHTGEYEDIYSLGYLWTSTWCDSYDDINVAYGIQIRKQFKDGGLARNTNTVCGKSVRCVKD